MKLHGGGTPSNNYGSYEPEVSLFQYRLLGSSTLLFYIMIILFITCLVYVTSTASRTCDLTDTECLRKKNEDKNIAIILGSTSGGILVFLILIAISQRNSLW